MVDVVDANSLTVVLWQNWLPNVLKRDLWVCSLLDAKCVSTRSVHSVAWLVRKCLSTVISHIFVDMYYLLPNWTTVYVQYLAVHFFLLCVFILVASVWHDISLLSGTVKCWDCSPQQRGVLWVGLFWWFCSFGSSIYTPLLMLFFLQTYGSFYIWNVHYDQGT